MVLQCVYCVIWSSVDAKIHHIEIGMICCYIGTAICFLSNDVSCVYSTSPPGIIYNVFASDAIAIQITAYIEPFRSEYRIYIYIYIYIYILLQ